VALKDSDARVRAIAARVAAMLDRADLAPVLLDLLATESDRDAAEEQVRALLFVGNGAYLDPVKRRRCARFSATPSRARTHQGETPDRPDFVR
jgi:hypothetical protein